MNPSFSNFRFPGVRPHPWNKVFRPNTPIALVDLVSKMIAWNADGRLRPMEAL